MTEFIPNIYLFQKMFVRPAIVLASVVPCAVLMAADTVHPFIKSHCIKCHGPDKQEGEVRLDDLPMTIADAETAERWDDVLSVLDAREMPPENEPKVNEKDRQQMVRIAKGLIDKRLSTSQALPQTPIRRMNRFQYNNAVTDLLELKVELFALPERMMRSYGDYFNPASGKMPDTVQVGSRPLGKSQLIDRRRLSGVVPFSQDLRAEHGFDNRGDHLSMSPLLMESFLKLSRSIVNSSEFGPATCGAWPWLFAPPAQGKDVSEAVRDRLRRLLTRAFRRPVDEPTLDRYTGYVLGKIEAGESFTDAIKQVVSATLASPQFLYLHEDSSDAEVAPLDNYEIASRLSFYLWASIPDQRLLDLAAKEQLSDPDVLGAELDRMLNDRKMKRFCDAFPAQWLQLEKIVSSLPRGKAAEHFYFYPSRFRASTHMMAEPLLLFEAIFVEDRPIVELIDPPFSYRSDLLNKWLKRGRGQFGGRSGKPMHFDRVENTDRREGGVITNPAVLTMTSGPEQTKPITRGAWIATVIFNAPPKPPPADVPTLPEAKDADTEHLTLRERLSAHRQREDCRGCHAKIDPFGFALENYDATGRWRDKYDNGRDVDASGVLFRERAFKNLIEFKDALLAEKDRFTHAFARHVLAYALGRDVGVADTPSVDEILRRTRDDKYKLRTLLKSVALSRSFLHKSTPGNTTSQHAEPIDTKDSP